VIDDHVPLGRERRSERNFRERPVGEHDTGRDGTEWSSQRGQDVQSLPRDDVLGVEEQDAVHGLRRRVAGDELQDGRVLVARGLHARVELPGEHVLQEPRPVADGPRQQDVGDRVEVEDVHGVGGQPPLPLEVLVPDGPARDGHVRDRLQGDGILQGAAQQAHRGLQPQTRGRHDGVRNVDRGVRRRVARGLAPASARRPRAQIRARREEVAAREVGQPAQAVTVGEVGVEGRQRRRRVPRGCQGACGPAAECVPADPLLDVVLEPAVLGQHPLEQRVLAGRVSIVARVLRLRHVLQEVQDVAEAAEEQRGLPLSLSRRRLDERAELVEPGVEQRELVLARGGSPPLLAERPRRRRQPQRDGSEVQAQPIHRVEEVVTDPIDGRGWVPRGIAAEK
jgi:hypothetical protein